MADRLTVVLCKARNPGPAQRHLEGGLADALAAHSDLELAVLPHLYDLAPDGPGLKYLRSITGHVAVLGWLYPRAAYWVLRANGIEGRMGHGMLSPDEEIAAAGPEQPERVLWCLDLRGQADTAAILSEVERMVSEAAGGAPACGPAAAGSGQAPQAQVPPTRIDEAVAPRWYPVIDQRRCENCLECLNFCLFGVFSLDELGKVFVEQADACRDGCPACSRICPPGAILFPEYPDPAIAGCPATVCHEFTQEKDALDQLVDELDGSDL
ncbi:MAG: ferredoxin family protein [Thermoguttaceae bacterium]|jgi:NAD-dependent dihydropyrimidine dehydrogenase PreA subunit